MRWRKQIYWNRAVKHNNLKHIQLIDKKNAHYKFKVIEFKIVDEELLLW